MGLLQKLKSALGLDGSGSSASGTTRDVDVTVEREPSTEDEDAVKGTNTAATTETHTPDTAGEVGSESGGGGDTPTHADEVETAASPITTDDESAAESGDVTTETEPETATDDEDTESDATDEEPDQADAGESAEADDEGSTAPVTDIKGIGPAYADRLADIGIETVGELAAADAADIAADTDLSESRVSGWIERAEDF